MRKRSNAFYIRASFFSAGRTGKSEEIWQTVTHSFASHETNERVWRLREAIAFRNVEVPLENFHHSK